ncbi:diacylglycerol/lipid kinase family protein [Nevskia soli]|jgi:YegS/Rv2252/BmrU family lipid kinase|uniref:diacylglycerol/lipid kinase family protein n=1 Tax=Nevskia soli TaxID=418856 RepID=UPI001C5CA313|nr:diacylglycerol kinase family protein [Nevskia soli]
MMRGQDNAIRQYQRAVIIYNPHAGQLRRGGLHGLQRAAEILGGCAAQVQLVATEAPRTAGRAAAEAIRDGADLIVAAGGDGTISEVAAGLAHSPVPLAILPAGTANVLAHEAHIPRSITRAARGIGDLVPHRVPLGCIETCLEKARYFVLMAGAGFDAQIIYELHDPLKMRLGKLAYFLGGMQFLGRRLEEVDVIFNGARKRCSFALISKVRNYGGDFEIATQVRLEDPEFEVVLFEGSDSWRYLHYLVAVTTRRLAHLKGVSFARTGSVDLESANGHAVYLQADGELIGALPARIRMVPDALTLLLPDRQRAKESR